MNLNLTPVEVNIDIESLSLERDAFYNVCFIAEHDTAERHITVNVLKDLLDAGYTRDSLAYNFCVGVFSQQTMPQVFIRAKRASETYQQAYDAESNEGYYFLVIQSKDDSVISSFESHVNSSGDSKLLFHSSDTNPLLNKKIVHYTHKLIDVDKDVTDLIYINVKDHYINKAYDLGYTTRDFDILSSEDFQRARLAYPESAWIATCGNVFPSTVQWLYKYLAKVEVNKDKAIPNLSNTSSMVIDNKATVGSGMTAQGIAIHEQVSLDWVQWALSRKVWSTLYNNEKINATQGGLALIVNDAKQVLDVAVEEGIFSEYRITDTNIDARSNKVSLYFTATLVQSILNVEVNGSLHY